MSFFINIIFILHCKKKKLKLYEPYESDDAKRDSFGDKEGKIGMVLTYMIQCNAGCLRKSHIYFFFLNTPISYAVFSPIASIKEVTVGTTNTYFWHKSFLSRTELSYVITELGTYVPNVKIVILTYLLPSNHSRSKQYQHTLKGRQEKIIMMPSFGEVVCERVVHVTAALRAGQAGGGWSGPDLLDHVYHPASSLQQRK